MQKENFLKQNSGFTLIELIVSILVSSVVILSAILFLSVCLNNYRDAAAETELMMESQIAVNMIREVVMEAKEPVEVGKCDGEYPYFAVRTEVGLDGSAAVENGYYHLFVHDTKGMHLLYYREEGAGPLSAEDWIRSNLLDGGTIDKDDLKQTFLADYVQYMELNTVNPQLPVLTMQFDCDGRAYHSSETILVRNALPDSDV